MTVSKSLKRATFWVTRPGKGQTIVQEDKDRVDAKLRRAAEAAYKAFWKVYK